jgi:omega-6 fatty acid desaturase (delta-12 desaturase)
LNNEGTPRTTTASEWLAALNRYRTPDHLRSCIEIMVTAVPFVLLWIAMWLSLQWSYLLTLGIAVPTAGFLVRLFMIQHDCGHGAFFRRRFANDWTGRVIGVLTLTPMTLGVALTPFIMPAREISIDAALATLRR